MANRLDGLVVRVRRFVRDARRRGGSRQLFRRGSPHARFGGDYRPSAWRGSRRFESRAGSRRCPDQSHDRGHDRRRSRLPGGGRHSAFETVKSGLSTELRGELFASGAVERDEVRRAALPASLVPARNSPQRIDQARYQEKEPQAKLHQDAAFCKGLREARSAAIRTDQSLCHRFSPRVSSPSIDQEARDV